LRHDFILADILNSEHSVFAKNGDIVALNGQENLNFITVETKTISTMKTDVIRLVRKEDESDLVKESLKR
jgi:hypothetical protein